MNDTTNFVVCAFYDGDAQRPVVLSAWFSPHESSEDIYFFGVDRGQWLRFKTPELALDYLKQLPASACEFGGVTIANAWSLPQPAAVALIDAAEQPVQSRQEPLAA